MSYAAATYRADGVTNEYTVPFPYIDELHVKVSVNGTETLVRPKFHAGSLRIAPKPQEGSVVTVFRETPMSGPLVDFQNGAVLTEHDLDTAVRQILFIQQELLDRYNVMIRERLLSMGGMPFETDPEKVVAMIANLVSEHEVLNRFRGRISDIDTNAEALINEALGRHAEAGERLKLAFDVDNVGSTLVNEIIARYELTLDLAEVNRFLDTTIAEFDTIILRLENEMIAGDTALAETLALIGAKTPDGLAFTLDINKVRVSPTESMATRLAAISAELGENAANIIAEGEARATATDAIAQTLALLGAKTPDGSAFLLDLDTVKVSPTESLAQRLTAITAETGGLSALLTEETTLRTTADEAFAATLSLMGAKSGDGGAFVLSDTTLKLSNGTALATALSGLTSRIGTAEGNIVNEAVTRATADGVLANATQVVASKLGDNFSAASTVSQAINGLYAHWGIKLNVNGFITGVILNNDGVEGSFNILADRFAVVDPNSGPGGSPQTVFEIINGVTRIRNLMFGNGNIGWGNLDLSSLGKIASDTGTASTTAWNFGDVATVVDFGVHLPAVNPSGSFSFDVEVYYTINGLNEAAGHSNIYDSGFRIVGWDNQGNAYAADVPYFPIPVGATSYSGVSKFTAIKGMLGTTQFSPTFVAQAIRGNQSYSNYEPEFGTTYYQQSVQVTITTVAATIRWSFI